MAGAAATLSPHLFCIKPDPSNLQIVDEHQCYRRSPVETKNGEFNLTFGVLLNEIVPG